MRYLIQVLPLPGKETSAVTGPGGERKRSGLHQCSLERLEVAAAALLMLTARSWWPLRLACDPLADPEESTTACEIKFN